MALAGAVVAGHLVVFAVGGGGLVWFALRGRTSAVPQRILRGFAPLLAGFLWCSLLLPLDAYLKVLFGAVMVAFNEGVYCIWLFGGLALAGDIARQRAARSDRASAGRLVVAFGPIAVFLAALVVVPFFVAVPPDLSEVRWVGVGFVVLMTALATGWYLGIIRPEVRRLRAQGGGSS